MTSPTYPNSYFDYSGKYNHNPYLSDISGQHELDRMISNIQGNLTASNVIKNQTEMNHILYSEKERLSYEKKQTDDAIFSQQRMINLNNSFRERYADYTKVLLIIIITLVTIVGIIILHKNITIIPSFIIYILIILVTVIGIFSSYYKYSLINARDRLYYDELNLQPPSISTSGQTAAAQSQNAATGNLLGTINIGGCIGPQCCSGNTIWDSGNSVCIASIPAINTSIGNTISTFVNLENAYTNGEMYQGNILPNSPNEFIKYQKI